MLLNIQNLNYCYAGASKNLFKNLNLKIVEPGFHALFGPSGVGKSTLAKIIAGHLSGFSGNIQSDGIKIALYTYNLERLPGWANLGEHFSEIVSKAEITPKSEKERLDDLIRSFGLLDFLKSRFSKLSLGQQNRANLARYLMQNFDLMIMDESLANVDEITRERIIFKIKKIFPEKCFLYISHNVAEVAKFCKKILILRGSNKSPQIVSIDGQNLKSGEQFKSQALEKTMLEIVNAS